MKKERGRSRKKEKISPWEEPKGVEKTLSRTRRGEGMEEKEEGVVDERVARTVAPPRQETAEERRQGAQRVLRVSGVRERKGEAVRPRGMERG